ncbi:hypothetical protein [Nitrosospira sp. Nsp1]|uniref:hypothetical protein n=1 Tax=Nitrosospira sp. Nsp1 TaxID=136547 RepID=UPI00088FEDA5|nr:hypothetical protein [Nitrosospira sp. Nsp1]SCX40508.1 hypothetical protein SAMN05720354_103121 [Nitrosospira sp. Nsp1]
MRYATFDSGGVLNARYDSKINPDIPSGAMEITDEIFFRTLNEQDGIWKLVNGFVVKTAFPAPVPYVPEKITMRQARLALLQSNLLGQVDALIATMPSSSRIEWEFAATVERAHPLVAALASELPLTAQQLDNLFTLANTL